MKAARVFCHWACCTSFAASGTGYCPQHLKADADTRAWMQAKIDEHAAMLRSKAPEGVI